MSENKSRDKTYICYEKPVKEHEVACIEAYWELEETDHTSFKTKTTVIGNIFPEKSSVETAFAYKKSSFTSSNEAFSCSKCRSKILVANRTEYLSCLNNKQSICELCISEQENNKLEEYRRIVNDYMENKKPSLDFYPEKLLYTEKLILFLAMTDDSFSMDVENDAIYYIFQKLCSKNIFMNLYSIQQTVTDAHRELKRLDNNYSPSINLLEKGFYFNKKDIVQKYPDIISFLTNEIENSVVKISEIDALKKLIIEEQKIKVNVALHDVVINNRISIENDIGLDSALDFLCENFSPIQICDLLNKTARDTIVAFHKNKSLSKNKNLFASKLNNFIDSVQSKGWGITYTRALPDVVEISLFESFVNKMIFPYIPNWNNLSGSEVFDAWMKILTVDEE